MCSPSPSFYTYLFIALLLTFFRDCHGYGKPWDKVMGVTGVGVWVGILYPRETRTPATGMAGLI